MVMSTLRLISYLAFSIRKFADNAQTVVHSSDVLTFLSHSLFGSRNTYSLSLGTLLGWMTIFFNLFQFKYLILYTHTRQSTVYTLAQFQACF